MANLARHLISLERHRRLHLLNLIEVDRLGACLKRLHQLEVCTDLGLTHLKLVSLGLKEVSREKIPLSPLVAPSLLEGTLPRII
jgi:hypothetical protein